MGFFFRENVFRAFMRKIDIYGSVKSVIYNLAPSFVIIANVSQTLR